eukprot:4695071-Karenia_brevis.AAC.1
MRRVAAIQRKTRTVLSSLHPALVVSIPKPLFSAREPITGVLRINGQDIGAVRADSKAEPHRLVFEPAAVQRYGFDVSVIKEKVLESLAASSRMPDTSNWLG